MLVKSMFSRLELNPFTDVTPETEGKKHIDKEYTINVVQYICN